MLFDTHMHCDYSCDSHMQVADAIEAAAAQKIGAIITEHWDYDYPTNPEEFIFNIEEYFAKLLPLRSEKLLIGIEIGMQTHTAAKDEEIAAAYDFDYVLGSIHCMGRKDIYEPSCYEGRTREEIIEEFFHDTMVCLEQHSNYDAFAHIDYMCRYWPYQGAERHLRLQDAPEAFDKLFKLLIEQNKPIEINTRRLDDEEAAAYLLEIYQRYQQLGGRYCTLGSDAHYKEHVGRRLEAALAMAKAAGLQPVYFKERKMQLIEV